MRSLAQIAVRVKALHPDDSVGTAAEAIRSSTVGALPVVRKGQLLGVLTSRALSENAADPRFRSASPSRVFQAAHVADLRLDFPAPLRDSLRADEALDVLRASDLEHAPVVEASGVLVGMVTRADLVSAVCGRIRPPSVGGMATLFGVYLTGGGARGGVGDLALMSTGAYLGLLGLFAEWGADVLAGTNGWLYHLRGYLPGLLHTLGSVFHALGNPHSPEELAAMMQATLERVSPDTVPLVLTLLLFALLFRYSRLINGYHAAEHQVVHAIEAGDELLPEVVREKPRVHPRCGTNLVVAVWIMTVFWYSRGEVPLLDELQPVVGMLITFLFWRRIGGWVQQHITTGPASRKQIDSGIRAARELIAQYQTGIEYRTPFQRLWNMGLLQVFGGMTTLYAGLWLLEWLHAPLPAAFR